MSERTRSARSRARRRGRLGARAARAAGPTRAARLDAWRDHRPRRRRHDAPPAISPHDPKVVVLGCDMTGAYITADGGASWRMFNLGSVPTAFAFDPSRTADDLRRRRGRLPQRRRRPHAGAWSCRTRRRTPWSGRSATTATASSSPTTRPTPAAAAASRSTRSRWTRTTRAACSSPRAPPTRRSPARPPRRRCSSARRTAAGRWSRTVTDLGTERVFALRRRAAGGERRESARSARRGVYVGARRRPGSTSPLRAEPASPPAASAATRARAWCSPTRPCRSRVPEAARRIAGGVQVSEDGGRTWHARERLAARRRARGGPRRELGTGAGARGRRSGRSRSSAHFPLVAYVGLRGIVLPGRGEAPFNGIAKTTRRRARRGASCTRSRTGPRRTSRRPGSSRAPRRTATRSGSTRPTTSPWRRTTQTSRTRPTSSAPTGPPTAADLGAGRTPSSAATTAGRRAAST